MVGENQNYKTKRKDFVEISFTGFRDGKPFDSNRKSDLKELDPKAKPEKTIVIIGEGMVVSGLDKAFEDKEIGKEYEVHLSYNEAFGQRKRELVKTIPLKVFTEQKIDPKPGATLFIDNVLVRVITISGARVVTDFNNPLAGKDLDYKFKIVRIIVDDKEKCEAFFEFFFRMIPDFELQDKKVIVKGPKPIEHIVEINKERFKKIMEKDLEFEEDLGSPQGGAPQQGEEAHSKSESEKEATTKQAPQ